MARRDTATTYPALDWLRFVLASTVVLSHSAIIGWAPAGNLAVKVFFALSGWLIGGIIFRTTREELPRFFYNRATRIWIPYGIALLLLYSVAAAREGIDNNWWRFLFADVTFTHNLAVSVDWNAAINAMPLRGTGNSLWSLGVEEQFYLIAPLVILFVSGGRSPIFWLTSAGVMLAVGTNAPSLCLGVAAAAFSQHRSNWHLTATARIALLAVTALTVTALVSDPRLYKPSAPLLAISLVLLCAVPGQRNFSGEVAGGLSFPLYLDAWVGGFAAHALANGLHLGRGASVEWIGYGLAVSFALAHYLLIDRMVMAERSKHYTADRGVKVANIAYVLVAVACVAYGFALLGMPSPFSIAR